MANKSAFQAGYGILRDSNFSNPAGDRRQEKVLRGLKFENGVEETQLSLASGEEKTTNSTFTSRSVVVNLSKFIKA